MRKILIGFVLVVIAGGIAYLHHRRHQARPSLETVYAANRQVTLWSTTAQVRESVATVNFGDRLEVIDRSGDEVRVRAAAGVTGWASESDLLSADLWKKAQDLNAKVSALPVEARGHTRVLSNMHIEPGRESARIQQLAKGTPADFFSREAAAVAGSNAVEAVAESGSADNNAPSKSESSESKKEDWWLVRAYPSGEGPQAGWVLGRFTDLDVPDPLPDYASAAAMRIVAYFELNKVPDSAGGTKPQYLVVGTHGGEGQACDFTMLHVFTWGSQRERYETAFVDSGLCGKLPVTLMRLSNGDLRFTFQNFSNEAPEARIYRMHQTIVRRVRNGEDAEPNRKTLKH